MDKFEGMGIRSDVEVTADNKLSPGKSPDEDSLSLK
jgi:hypothetical protein